MTLDFMGLLRREFVSLLSVKGQWSQALWFNFVLLLVFGLAEAGSFSTASLLALFWVMFFTFYLLILPLAYRQDQRLGVLDQLRLSASPHTIVWAKALSMISLIFFCTASLLFVFVLLLGLVSWPLLASFFLASIPGMVILSHYLDLLLLEQDQSTLLLGLLWLPNTLPYVLLSYLYVVSSEPSALYYTFALSFFWLAAVPIFQQAWLRTDDGS